MTEHPPRIRVKTPIGDSFAIYDAAGNEIPGYLVIDDDGFLRFELRDPNQKPDEE